MGCVADHVDKSALFDEPTAIHLASARLVDGRAIHHYLMFIEPVLEASKGQARQMECMLGETGLMNIAARRADGERAPGSDSHSTLKFFEEITAEQGAAAGLWNAACRFICKWISAEHIVNGVPDIYVRRRADDFRTLIELFADSVVSEARRRSGHRRSTSMSVGPEELLQFLQSFPHLPHTQELVSCWYPGWNRVLFIYDSPFDPMTNLMQRSFEMTDEYTP